MNEHIDTLIRLAVQRNGVKIVHPCRGQNWEDCYVFDSGYHVLCYKFSQDELTCHEIAIDENGDVLEEE